MVDSIRENFLIPIVIDIKNAYFGYSSPKLCIFDYNGLKGYELITVLNTLIQEKTKVSNVITKYVNDDESGWYVTRDVTIQELKQLEEHFIIDHEVELNE